MNENKVFASLHAKTFSICLHTLCDLIINTHILNTEQSFLGVLYPELFEKYPFWYYPFRLRKNNHTKNRFSLIHFSSGATSDSVEKSDRPSP